MAHGNSGKKCLQPTYGTTFLVLFTPAPYIKDDGSQFKGAYGWCGLITQFQD